MASQVFYRKWRSQTLSELVGQSHVTQTLLNALKNGNISHAYLFCGPRGTGKTSTARILAKAVNCLTNNGRGEPCNNCVMCRAIMEDRAMDVIEIDAASNRGIDDIRDLREKVNYAPAQARRKVYIIDEFHMLSKDASNALLKTLEEPPPHVIFILATTEAHKVLPTILSRCQHFDFHRLSRADVASQLSKVCAGEKITIEAKSLQLIARSTTGSLRDALNLLEQLTTYYGPEVTFTQVQTMLGITGDARAKEIVKHIMQRDLSAGMAALIGVNNDGLDLRQFNRELVEYLRGLLLVKTGAADAVDLTVEDIAELQEIAAKASLPQILSALKLFGQINIGNNDNTTLPLELALVDCYLAQEEKSSNEAKPSAEPLPPPARTVPPVSRTAPEKPADKMIQSSAAGKSPELKTGLVAEKTVNISNPPSPVEKLPEQKRAAASQMQEKSAEYKPVLPDTAPAAAPLSSEFERLKLNWKQVIESAGIKRTAASALLKSGSRPVSIEGETLILAFGYPIHKDNFEKPENIQIAEKIISAYLGHPCKITCVLDTKNDHLVTLAKKMGAQVVSTEGK
jgi:DNA polymerase III subunit gamma/tau